jgi:hypothetical protein
VCPTKDVPLLKGMMPSEREPSSFRKFSPVMTHSCAFGPETVDAKGPSTRVPDERVNGRLAIYQYNRLQNSTLLPLQGQISQHGRASSVQQEPYMVLFMPQPVLPRQNFDPGDFTFSSPNGDALCLHAKGTTRTVQYTDNQYENPTCPMQVRAQVPSKEHHGALFHQEPYVYMPMPTTIPAQHIGTFRQMTVNYAVPPVNGSAFDSRIDGMSSHFSLDRAHEAPAAVMSKGSNSVAEWTNDPEGFRNISPLVDTQVVIRDNDINSCRAGGGDLRPLSEPSVRVESQAQDSAGCDFNQWIDWPSDEADVIS